MKPSPRTHKYTLRQCITYGISHTGGVWASVEYILATPTTRPSPTRILVVVLNT